MRIREPWPSARTRQRRREFNAVFEGVPPHSLGRGLEIGGGDGFLASLLAPYCASFVTTDPYRPRLLAGDPGQVRRLVCDATVLPFADASFDFIFSSSVLEHVRHREPAFREMRRCLRPGGFMLHIMPSRTWKVLQLIFYYPHLLLGGLDAVFDGLTARSRLPPRSTATRAPAPTSPACVTDRWSDERTWRLTLKTVLQGIVPRVHGEYAGHVAEWDGFGAQAWHDELGRHGLAVHTVMRLPLYSGYGFGFNRLRLLGERWGLSSHNAFVVSEKTARPSAVQWFERGPRRLSPRDPS